MFFFKNYNKFLIGNTESFRWDDFYIHRFVHDFDKLVKFNTFEEAQKFLEQHPEIGKDFDAWIVKQDRSEWLGEYHPLVHPK